MTQADETPIAGNGDEKDETRFVMKIGFLFNHDAGHQAGHLLPILNALAALRSNCEIRAYVGGPDMREIVAAALSPAAMNKVRIIDLSLPGPMRRLVRRLDKAAPISRVARLMLNADLFRDLDALAAPERTCLILKDCLRDAPLKFIHVRHGAGDRAVGFHPSFAKFDLLLLQGEKYVRRLRQSGGLAGNAYALIGYPKFDQMRERPLSRKFFDNDRPTVVYNPHFSPDYSSWYRMGDAVLDYFARHPEYNLIFAPHVMLFKKRLHFSLDTRRWSWRREFPEKFYQYKNILVDLDGPKLFDMTYMLDSDIYLGDISSQVIEFIAHPRPCIFLNVRNHNWRGDEDFAAWRLGPVLTDLSELDKTLAQAVAHPDSYALAQRAHFSDTFDLTAEPSADRAAWAILNFVGATVKRDVEVEREAELHIGAQMVLSN